MGKLTLAPADMHERWAALKAENARLRKALMDILGMSSAFSNAVKGQPYTSQSAEFVFKQAREVIAKSEDAALA